MGTKVAGIIVAALLVIGSVGYWVFVANDNEDKTVFSPKKAVGLMSPRDDYSRAQQYIREGKGQEAITLIQEYKQLPSDERGQGLDWDDLELQAAWKERDFPRLVHMFMQNPAAFEKHEEVSLSLARLFVQFEKWNDYDDIRGRWKEKRTQQTNWFLLDADYLMLRGKLDEAQELLQSQHFKGDPEIERLLRLALLQSRGDLRAAWDSLAVAYQLDPRNAKVRSLRGHILESLYSLKLARVEYIAAFVADRSNPNMRDQLAEFYRRHHDYGLALNTWADGLENESADFIWTKAMFWSKMVYPIPFDWDKHQVPQGRLTEFVSYLGTLKQDEFWDEDQFQRMPDVISYVRGRQEIYWLRLLEALKEEMKAKP